MRLIDANKLIAKWKPVVKRYEGDSKYWETAYILEGVIEDVENEPTVDAEPVRHGHWTEKRNPMMYQLIPYVWVCDQCGTAFYYKTPYCGECGARMQGDNNGNK